MRVNKQNWYLARWKGNAELNEVVWDGAKTFGRMISTDKAFYVT